MYVNARLWIGHFDLWPEDGTIVFRHAMIFPGRRRQRLAMRSAAQSGAGSLRALLPGLPVRAVGRQDRRGCRRRRGAGVRGPGVSGAPSLLIGAGRMGGALLKGWIARKASARSSSSSPSRRRHCARWRRQKAITLVGAPSQVTARKLSACVVALKPQILKNEAPVLAAFAQARRADDLHRRGHPYQIAVQGLGRKGAHHPRHAQHARRHRPRHHRAVRRQRRHRGRQDARPTRCCRRWARPSGWRRKI